HPAIDRLEQPTGVGRIVTTDQSINDRRIHRVNSAVRWRRKVCLRKAPDLAEIDGSGYSTLTSYRISNLRRAGGLAKTRDVKLGPGGRIDETAHTSGPSLAAIRSFVEARVRGCNDFISAPDQKRLTGEAVPPWSFRTHVGYPSTFNARDELRMDRQ